MIPRRSRINRRAFLRGVGTAGVALPFLESIPERSAWAATETPVFGLFVCTSCGVVQQTGQDPERFWPTSFGALTTASMEAFSADRCTGLLAEHASRLLIVKGVRYPYSGSGCGHAQGLVQCLTSSQPSGDAQNTTSTGPSADTIIASAVNPSGVEPLTLYAGTKRGYIEEKLSFRSAGQVRAAEGNPYNVLQRLTGLFQPDTGEPTGMGDQLALRRNSVNDLIREDTQALLGRPELSKADRDRINQHLQAIRDMEVMVGQMGATCSDGRLDLAAIEAMNDGTAFQQDDNIETVVRLQIELAALAFSCNATRVATIQCGDGTDPTRYTIDGTQYERFHWVSHRIMSDGGSGTSIPNAVNHHIAIDRLRMGTLKAALDKWAQYSTANGSLFDNAFMLWTNHVATGPGHSFSNLPVIIAGSAGGLLKQGQYIDAQNATNNKLMNTLITACGVPTEDFGGSGLSGGLISGILA